MPADIALQQDVALLPHPPDALSSIPMGISGQSRLARALETVLQHGSAKANTASRFLQACSGLVSQENMTVWQPLLGLCVLAVLGLLTSRFCI